MFTGHEGVPDEIKTSANGSKLVETSANGSKLVADFGLLYLNEKSSHVTFLVDGEKLPAHKTILTARSKCFEAFFSANAGKEIISKSSPEALRLLLKYIYTDTFTMVSDSKIILQVLVLARQHSFKRLTSSMIEETNTILEAKNVIFLLNGANDHNLDELRVLCHSFIDDNSLQILSSDSFYDLTRKSLIQILKRDTFLAPEIEIFKYVAKWCEKNNDNVVLECVRLSLLSVSEILSVVWPTKLLTSEELLEAIAEIVGTRSKDLLPRAILSMDENIATVRHGAEFISELDTSGLLAGNTDVNKNVQYTMDGEHGIVVCLHRPYCINHIRMMLYDADDRYYSYYIERSLDRKKWHKIVDSTRYACRSVQNLYFEQQVAQYIKIVGTSNSKGNDFHLVFFEAFYKSEIPKTINAIVCPVKNVATPENKAIVIAGNDPGNLLDGNYIDDYLECSTSHKLADSCGIIVQLAQPYVISSMQLLLYHKNRYYKYFIETSVNKRDWKILIDRRNEECLSWQKIHFEERIVVFIKITGTYTSQYDTFRCIHFECPSEDKK